MVYLKSNVIAEPLFASWYAWPHLISPATCAMNIVGRHLKIMNSYIQSPQVHAAAVKNPAMLGGPFIDYAANRVAEVALLRDKTLNEQAVLLDFAQAIQQLTQLLKDEATGFSLVVPKDVPETRAPTADELRLLRDVVDPRGLGGKELGS